MNLWIRSQNKEVLMTSPELRYNQKGDDHSILAYDTLGVFRVLGIYKTKERALEVLDEIQNILKPIIKINYEYDDSLPIMNGKWLKFVKEESEIKELSTYVYEMPEN